jgi:ornithine carbamoyltransferase
LKQDLLTLKQLTANQALGLLQLAGKIKANPQAYNQTLAGQSIVGWFEKPSLRTRVSFDIGIHQLGGHFVYLDSQANQLSGREEAKDMGANLACWADAIVARLFKHSTLQQLSLGATTIPVINALCDLYHPCQALADYLTLMEVFDDLSDTKLAYIGDGNNVSHSLMILGTLLGSEVVIVTPQGYEPNSDLIVHCQQVAEKTGASLQTSNDLNAAQGAQVIYGDTWVSMGDKADKQKIKAVFADYQINEALMQKTGATYVMHCQPAYRDIEISGSLIDSEHSLLMQQAENRMFAQNAILAHLVGGLSL